MLKPLCYSIESCSCLHVEFLNSFRPFFSLPFYEPASSCPLLPFLYPCPAPVDSPVGEEWSPWSVCSATCGEGWQSRTRFCVSASYSTQCSGPLREQRPCNNTAVCPGKRSPPRPLQYHQPEASNAQVPTHQLSS